MTVFEKVFFCVKWHTKEGLENSNVDNSSCNKPTRLDLYL